MYFAEFFHYYVYIYKDTKYRQTYIDENVENILNIENIFIPSFLHISKAVFICMYFLPALSLSIPLII